MKIAELSSAQNAKYKRWLSLLESRGIKKEQRALVSGSKILNEVIVQQPQLIEEILLPPKVEPLAVAFPQTRLSSPLFRDLDVIRTKSPLAVLRTPEIKPWTPREKPEGLELIVALSDPSNLGSCLRSAEAFGATRVILAQECASPYLPKALRASSGSALRLKLNSSGPLADLPALQNAVGLDMKGRDLKDFEWPKDVYLFLGEEGQGLPEALKLQAISIPMRAPVESLNATVAAALALFSYRLYQTS
jgi:TrmH family RNA methyltransferase